MVSYQVLALILLLCVAWSQSPYHSTSNRCSFQSVIQCSLHQTIWTDHSRRVSWRRVLVPITVFVMRLVSLLMDWRVARSTWSNSPTLEWSQFSMMCSWNTTLLISQQSTLFTSEGFKTRASFGFKPIATHKCGLMTRRKNQRCSPIRLKWLVDQVSSNYPYYPSPSRNRQDPRSVKGTIRNYHCRATPFRSNSDDLEGDLLVNHNDQT